MTKRFLSIKVFLLILVATINSQKTSDILELTLLTEYKRAKCLDGSPTGFYFRQGNGEGINNFMIHLQGGEWCKGETEEEIIQNCIRRTTMGLGSSLFWPQNMTNDANLSPSITNNPAFYNWNVIFVNYCDGLAYQGSSEKVVNEQTTLYFRGKDNMIALFDHLIKKKGLDSASKIVLSGSSAGGIGALNWSTYLRTIIPKQTLVQSIIDSGFFVDDGWFNPKMWRILIDLAYNNDRQQIVPSNCLYLKDDSQLFKCIQPAYTYKQLQLPTLLILSSYDTYVLYFQKQISCLINYEYTFFSFGDCNESQWRIIEQLRQKTIQTLQEIIEEKSNVSVWTISCLNHVFLQDKPFYSQDLFTSPYPNGINASEAILQFLNHPQIQKSYIDISSYPENEKCSYLVEKKDVSQA